MADAARSPIKLTLLKGKTHFTKAEIQERIDTELPNNTDNIKPPAYLDATLKKEFKKIAKELVRLGIFSNLDCDALARFLVAREQYVKTVEVLRDADIRDDIVYYERIIRVNDRLFQQCKQSSTELGLSVSGRGRLLVPKITKQREDYVAEKFGV